jgi:hypothetical protein
VTNRGDRLVTGPGDAIEVEVMLSCRRSAIVICSFTRIAIEELSGRLGMLPAPPMDRS